MASAIATTRASPPPVPPPQQQRPPPPFSKQAEPICATNPTLPASYRKRGSERRLVSIDSNDKTSVEQYIDSDVDVSRLNCIHRHLWIAGLPQISRSLHEQTLLRRTIALTDQADLHLVWSGNIIFIKPVPEYLLNHAFWSTHICPSQSLHESARGLLLSYLWLLPSRADFILAIEHQILPPTLQWNAWVTFSASVLALDNPQRLDHATLQHTNSRYLYGELRLDRLSLIYRFCSVTHDPWTFVRGYQYNYANYTSFIERNFTWAITAAIYITIVLTAMQVGLATKRLQDDKRFHDAAFGFTVFSIVAPLAVIAAAMAIVVVVFAISWRYAKRRQREAAMTRPHVGKDVAAQHARSMSSGLADGGARKKRRNYGQRGRNPNDVA
ncbi:hypothetical protein FB567DRAFT_587351 [Paraphoma chrysanthemicola]|uniref:Uncharacterized protein n=1 Tax=Paraphoma chrysanthemicola TaxID=798071 RepID=A0A8K0RJQ1_9PLEO|nr:hypothetical protein FB567DRAFT_587351 [Paraphoma chrysanthemicola]